jgi:hypothetical protein
LFGRAAAKAPEPQAEREAPKPLFGTRSGLEADAPAPLPAPANEREAKPQIARQPEREAERNEPLRPLERTDRFDRSDRFERSAQAEPVTARAAQGGGGGGGWTWRDLMASVDAPETSSPARRAPEAAPAAPIAAAPERDDAVSRLTRSVSHLRPVEPASGLAVVEACGVRLPEVFSMAALDRIAHRARNGTQARRRAVKDAAGDAVTRLGAYLDANPQARQDASGFMSREGARIAELLGRGRASMSSDATRAFLLIDAAIG